jgi:hypothetical protein
MKLVIDSGATSHFVPEELNLPKKGKSDKEVFLPDNSSLQASYKTELPFEQIKQKRNEQRSGQTMHMIYHPSNKLLDTSTQWQDSQSKTHGSKQ